MQSGRNPVKHQLKIYGPAALLVIAAFVMAFQFIKPAPPDHVVIASGGVDGAYHEFALRYAKFLDREGIALEVRATAGSVENLKLLRDGEVDMAMLQGGVAAPSDDDALVSLGSLYYEPLWLFHRRGIEIRQLRDLSQRRVAAGAVDSGTRALVEHLLLANGAKGQAELLETAGEKAVEALVDGEVDAAFFVISARSALVERLLREPQIAVFDFSRSTAYARRYPYLNDLVLPEGVVDLAANIPSRDVRLLAPTANLVARADLHPAIVDLMLQAATEIHRAGGWFERPDEFPKPELLVFPLSKEAERFYKHGPPFLQRYLPFWAASLIDRLKVMLLPLLVLLLPLIKVMPPIYTWRMRARVYRWYDELEQAEHRFASGDVDAAWVRDELARIELDVQQVNVPLSFTDQLYHLRQHIDLVRRQVVGHA